MNRTNPAAAAAVRGGLVARGLAIALLGVLCPFVHANDNSSSSGTGPAEGCNPGSQNEGFWRRLSDSYKAHLFPSDAPAPAPTARPAAPLGYDPDRVPPPPQSVPPWPYSTWPMGGTQAIGYENIYYGPLMDAIWCGRNGRKWKDTRWAIYGWLEAGGNISTSSTHDAIELRPELRYERAFDQDAYNNPTATLGAGKKDQFMFAADAIFHF